MLRRRRNPEGLRQVTDQADGYLAATAQKAEYENSVGSQFVLGDDACPVAAQRHGLRLFRKYAPGSIYADQQDTDFFGNSTASTHESHECSHPHERPYELSAFGGRSLFQALTDSTPLTVGQGEGQRTGSVLDFGFRGGFENSGTG
jgi:hypothetical protein